MGKGRKGGNRPGAGKGRQAPKPKKAPAAGGRPAAPPPAPATPPPVTASATGSGTGTGASTGAASGASTGAASAAKRTRAERLQAERAARRRRAVRNRIVIVAVVLVLLGAAVTAFVADRRADRAAIAKVNTEACKYDSEYDDDSGTGRNHVPSASYRVNPPAGGDHLAAAAAAGRYTPDNAPPDGQIVHAMEHGFVVLWHRPDLSESDRAAVEQVADRFREELLVVPRASLSGPVAVTAWHRRLTCTTVDTRAISDFVTQFRDQGPEKGFL